MRQTLRHRVIASAALGAALVGGSVKAQPGDDLCSQATRVFGDQTVFFDLATADVDGLAHAECSERPGDAQIYRDVWWLWTAMCDGPARISACGLTSVDTKIVVYAIGGPCPPSDDYILACNDQSCGNQSEVTFVAQAGQRYLVRLGRYAGASGLTGQVRFECVHDAMGEGEFCRAGGPQSHSANDGWARVADRWTPPADGVIDSLTVTGHQGCGQWSPPESARLRVVYYRDTNGRPGPAMAWFAPDAVAFLGAWQPGGGWVDYAYYTQALRHAPVEVRAGETIWIEVTSEHPALCWSWRMREGGDGAAHDGTPTDSSWANAAISSYGMDRCIGFKPTPCAADINGDGTVNFADLNGVLSGYNAVCP